MHFRHFSHYAGPACAIFISRNFPHRQYLFGAGVILTGPASHISSLSGRNASEDLAKYIIQNTPSPDSLAIKTASEIDLALDQLHGFKAQ